MLGTPPPFEVRGRTFWRPNEIRSGVDVRRAKASDVVSLRAAFFEWDDCSVPEQLQRIQGLPLPPSALIWTGGKSIHVYYVLREPVPISGPGDPAAQTWGAVQRGIIQHCGSDRAIIDLGRAMAHPLHPYDRTVTEPVMPLGWLGDGPRYRLEQLTRAFPWEVPASSRAVSAPPPSAPPPSAPPPGKVLLGGRVDMATAAEQFRRGVALIPTGGRHSGTWQVQYSLVCSSLQWAVVEHHVPLEWCQRMLEAHLSAARGKDIHRLLYGGWKPDSHGAGTWVRHCQQHGILPRPR